VKREKINPVRNSLMRNNMTQKGKISNGVNRRERRERRGKTRIKGKENGFLLSQE